VTSSGHHQPALSTSPAARAACGIFSPSYHQSRCKRVGERGVGGAKEFRGRHDELHLNRILDEAVNRECRSILRLHCAVYICAFTVLHTWPLFGCRSAVTTISGNSISIGMDVESFWVQNPVTANGTSMSMIDQNKCFICATNNVSWSHRPPPTATKCHRGGHSACSCWKSPLNIWLPSLRSIYRF
jgi:hypothetical protein